MIYRHAIGTYSTLINAHREGSAKLGKPEYGTAQNLYSFVNDVIKPDWALDREERRI